MFPPFRPPFPDDPDGEAPGGRCGPRFGLFGRHRGGPFERRSRSRLFDSGALRLVVLGLIGEAPRHGYDIIRGLKARFQGSYSPSPGAIYPILQMLEGAALVASSSHGPRRHFAITEAGRAYLAERKGELDAINAQIDEAAAPIGESGIGEAVQTFRTTLFAKARQGLTADQAGRLREILARARDEIERL